MYLSNEGYSIARLMPQKDTLWSQMDAIHIVIYQTNGEVLKNLKNKLTALVNYISPS